MSRRSKLFTPQTLLLLLLFVGMGWVAAGFWGNPWVRLTLSGRVTDYLSDRYPQTRFVVASTGYDFLNGRYVVSVTSDTKPAITAIVELYRNGKAHDDYLEQKLEVEMAGRLTPVVKSALPEATVTAKVALLDDSKYGEEVTYGPAVRGRLSVGVSWNLASTEPERFVQQATAVLAAFRQSGLRIDQCTFWGRLGDRSYALSLTHAQMAFTDEQLLPLVGRPGKW